MNAQQPTNNSSTAGPDGALEGALDVGLYISLKGVPQNSL